MCKKIQKKIIIHFAAVIHAAVLAAGVILPPVALGGCGRADGERFSLESAVSGSAQEGAAGTGSAAGTGGAGTDSGRGTGDGVGTGGAGTAGGAESAGPAAGAGASGTDSGGEPDKAGEGIAGGEKSLQENRNTVLVYVCGAVLSPGVVELPEGSRADAAVKLAGGMTEEADASYVNLAAKVEDGEKLYIPVVGENVSLNEGQEQENGGLVNINTADIAQLCTLPGIGESRAADIIACREQNGKFGAIEDIMKVPGIKEAAFARLRDRITVG